MRDTFIIVPTYNEDIEVLKKTLVELLRLFQNIIVVNDGGTISLKDELKNLSLYYLRHEINLGQGAALQTGMEYALDLNAQKVAFFDADGQHNPLDLLQMIKTMGENKYDIILGSRFINRGHSRMIPVLRRMILKGATYINFLFTGILLTDAHHGLKVIHWKAARKIEFRQNKQLHATELLRYIKKLKFSYLEMPAAVEYTSYSIKKGQKNHHVFQIFSDLIFSKFIK